MSTHFLRHAVVSVVAAAMALALIPAAASGQAVSIGTNPPGIATPEEKAKIYEGNARRLLRLRPC